MGREVGRTAAEVVAVKEGTGTGVEGAGMAVLGAGGRELAGTVVGRELAGTVVDGVWPCTVWERKVINPSLCDVFSVTSQPWWHPTASSLTVVLSTQNVANMCAKNSQISLIARSPDTSAVRRARSIVNLAISTGFSGS